MKLVSLILLLTVSCEYFQQTTSDDEDEQPNHYDKYDSKLYEECTVWLSQCESDWECCQPLVCRWKPFIKTYRCEREYFFPLGMYIPPKYRSPPPPTHVPPPPKWWRLKDFIPYI